MKNQLFMILLASASASLFAMDKLDPLEKYLNIKLVGAVNQGDLNQIKRFISAGSSLNPPKRAFNPLCAAITSFKLQPQQHLEIIKLLLDNGAMADLQVNIDNATPLMIAAEYGTPQEVLLLLSSIPLEERQYIKNTFPIFSKKMRTTGLIGKDTHGLIQEQVIEQLVERNMLRIAQLVEMKQTDGKTAQDLSLRNQLHHQAIGGILDLTNPASYAQIRAAVERNIRRILFGRQN